jgi:hypothetical protein
MVYQINVENVGNSAITPRSAPSIEANPGRGRHHPMDPSPQAEQMERSQEEELLSQSRIRLANNFNLKMLGTIKHALGRTRCYQKFVAIQSTPPIWPPPIAPISFIELSFHQGAQARKKHQGARKLSHHDRACKLPRPQS